MYAKAKEAIANKEMTEEKLEMPSNPTNLSTADTNQTFIDPTNVTQAHKSQVAHRRFVENALKDSYVLGMIGEFLRMKAQEQAQGTGPVTPAPEEYIAPIAAGFHGGKLYGCISEDGKVLQFPWKGLERGTIYEQCL
jgi:hypothetical protein